MSTGVFVVWGLLPGVEGFWGFGDEDVRVSGGFSFKGLGCRV